MGHRQGLSAMIRGLASLAKGGYLKMGRLTYSDPLAQIWEGACQAWYAIGCPTLISGIIADDVHPLGTVMPVFEKIPAIKCIMVYPDADHEYKTDFTHHGNAWMDRYLR